MNNQSSNHQKIGLLHREQVVAQLLSWVNINTSSDNIPGLLGFASMLKQAYASLGGESTLIPLPERTVITESGKLSTTPSGNALHIVKRSNAPLKILLGGHMDTVFPLTSTFQTGELVSSNKLKGPGTADMKGGLMILLKGLEIFESSLHSDNIGIEILITPDEEIGSMASRQLWIDAARRNHLCIIFEPSHPDGSLVSERKGSVNLAVIAHGKSAHAGREFHMGKNAIVALSHFIVKAHALNAANEKILLNIGQIEGPGSCGVVPDLAICRLNIRSDSQEELLKVTQQLEEIKDSIAATMGMQMIMHTLSSRVPKPFQGNTINLFEAVQDAAKTIGIDLKWHPSGGVCDGNIVAAAGIPTIDTLGAIGGNMHSKEEYILINSLTDRAQLLALFLMQLSTNQTKFKVK